MVEKYIAKLPWPYFPATSGNGPSCTVQPHRKHEGQGHYVPSLAQQVADAGNVVQDQTQARPLLPVLS